VKQRRICTTFDILIPEQMVSHEQFKALALSLPHTIEAPHFDRTAFKIIGKRIFATLHEKSHTANFKFSPADQSVYSLIDKSAIYPVNNKWGLQGWTTFELDKIDSQLVLEALTTAYEEALKSSSKRKP
jgi:predicted DNA-binding protein (MmcQ/YjbR family)